MDHHRAYDVTVIGGGLHGAAIAANCAGKGLRTLLCDAADVGGNHNLVSARLFHCGLQYLQRGDLARVSESLTERARLRCDAPHLVLPTTVILPQKPGLRSRVKISAEAFLYRLVAGQSADLDAINIAGTPWAEPLQTQGSNTPSGHFPALRFEDALVDDARLTMEYLVLARQEGATILPYTRLNGAKRNRGDWQLLLQDTKVDRQWGVRSRCVINAAGPDAAEVQRNILGISSRCSAENYSAGYLVLPRLFAGDQTYLIQGEDAHMVAALPYLEHYTLVGPILFAEHPSRQQQTLDETQTKRLLNAVQTHFNQKIQLEDVLHSFVVQTSSFRETPESQPTPFSQDYVLDFNCSDGRSPAVTLFGACINMHRVIASQVVEQINSYLDKPADVKPPPPGSLPGARGPSASLALLPIQLAEQFPWLPEQTRQRICALYGTRARDLIGGCRSLEDFGKEVLPSLYEREAHWLQRQEWAVTPDAILWHRTKLGTGLSETAINEFNQWFIKNFPYTSGLNALHSNTQWNKEAS